MKVCIPILPRNRQDCGAQRLREFKSILKLYCAAMWTGPCDPQDEIELEGGMISFQKDLCGLQGGGGKLNWDEKIILSQWN